MTEPLRIVVLGRLDPTKGIHVLIHAFQLAPSLRAKLDVYGIAQGSAGTRYADDMRQLAADDPRISFLPPVAANRAVDVIKQYDVLAVPSQWLETGPLVVLEAFAARVPVVGSRLGGIAELVRHYVNGVLVEPANPAEWAHTFEQLANNRTRLDQLRSGITSPRSMAHVAEDMATVYAAITSTTATRHNLVS